MASDIFAKIGSVAGETLDARHKDEIDVLSFSWGVANGGTTPAGSGAGMGKATLHDFSFVHRIDKASPALMKLCATGTHVPEATITHRKAGRGQQEYLIVKLTDVIVSSVTHGGASTGEYAETVSLQSARVQFDYKPQRADGSLDTAVSFKFDVKTQREG